MKAIIDWIKSLPGKIARAWGGGGPGPTKPGTPK